MPNNYNDSHELSSINSVFHLWREGGTDLPLTKDCGTISSNLANFWVPFGGPISPDYIVVLLFYLIQNVCCLLGQTLLIRHFPSSLVPLRGGGHWL